MAAGFLNALAAIPQGIMQGQQFANDQNYIQALRGLALQQQRQQLQQQAFAQQVQSARARAALSVFGQPQPFQANPNPFGQPDQQQAQQFTPQLPQVPNASGQLNADSLIGTPQNPGLIPRDESGGRNVPNYRFDPTHTASGPLQITNTTYNETAPSAGAKPLGPGEYAMNRPLDEQYRVGGALLKQRGTSPWANFNPKLAADLKANLPPEHQQQGTQTATTAAAMLPPIMAGQYSPQQIMRAVQQANPDAPDEVKGLAAIELYHLMAPNAQQQFADMMRMVQFQNTQRHEGVMENIAAAGKAETERYHQQTENKPGQPIVIGDKVYQPMPDGTLRPMKTPEGVTPEQVQGAHRIGSGAAGRQPEPDPQKDTMARAIAEYRLSPLSGWALRTPWGKQTMENVIALNHDYQATEYGARQSAARAFASGRQGDAVRFINVAIDHLSVADQLADALQNGDTRALNRLKNAVQSQLGYEAPLDFETAKLIVGDEIAKAVIGGVGSARDRSGLQDQLNAANSPEQLKGVSTTYKRLMAGQLGGLERQYETGTGQGAGKFQERLSPGAQRELGGYMQGDGNQGQGDQGPEISQEQYNSLPSGAPYRVPGNPKTFYKQ
jgi:hypothetical protein